MKISVLVPTLGTREKAIRRLLETLEKQSYKDFEIIFVTQDNHEIVKDIICKYSNLDIKQIEMSVKGLSRARNRGLEQASGEIVVLSDDDCWYPANAFEIVVNAFKKRQCAKIVLSQIFDPEKIFKKILFLDCDCMIPQITMHRCSKQKNLFIFI